MSLNGVIEKDSYVSCYVDASNSVLPTGDIKSYMPGCGGGIIARHTANTSNVYGDSYMYLGMIARIGSVYYGQIWVNNGSWLLLNSSAINSSNTIVPGLVVGVLAFKVMGNSLTLYFNNIQVAYASDETIPGYGGLGLRSLGPGCVFDNFNANSISNYSRSNIIDRNYVNWGLLRAINQNNILGWGG